MYTHRNTTHAARGFYVNRALAAAAATLLTAVWMVAAQPAHAAASGPATARISYADLNLNSEAGARTLYQRLKRAAERVCDGVDRRGIGPRECYETALADAVNDVGAPRLQALHRGSGVSARRSG
jgi:UrcA family protein